MSFERGGYEIYKNQGQNFGTEDLVHFSSVAQSCLTFCDPMDFNTPGSPVLQYLLEFAQTHVH